MGPEPKAVAPGRGGLLRRALREPMVHFLLLGALVFLAYGVVAPPPPPVQGRIVVTAADADRLAAQFRATWGRAPTPEELRGQIDLFVREEVYYREARAYGLDLDDQVVRVRMRQKMEFLLADPAAVPDPTEAELRALFAATAQEYAQPARVAFRQVLLADASQGGIDAARRALVAGADPASVGAPGLLPAELPLTAAPLVDSQFGAGVFAQLVALPQGVWAGPVRSGFGAHLVQVSAVERAAPPSFDALRPAIEAAWRREALRKAAEAAYAGLKARYEIDLSQTGFSQTGVSQTGLAP